MNTTSAPPTVFWAAALLCGMAPAGGAELPERYYRLMEAGLAAVDAARLPAEPEARPQSHFYPGALLAAAVLYAKSHPANRRHGNAGMLALALKLGDLLARESETGIYVTRQDHHRDTYMWLEAYRLAESNLGEQRRQRWRHQLEELLAEMARDVEERQDRPAYKSPFGVSVNHTALRASTVYLGGKMFGNPAWERLGAKVMHRYAAEEQSPDGYWGEHSDGPTTAYEYLTAAGVALYWEHSRDPAALAALRRSTDFHKFYTYPDGQPVMLIDDRRRHAYISPWAHFGFSNFPDGRRYAGFLTGFYRDGQLSMEHLGRVAQNALYFHDGPVEPIPQDRPSYSHRMSVPAGIRKAGPWTVSLSGLISTQAVTSRYYLDRQGHLDVFHEKLGLILSGANSKRQPELATFRETIGGQVYHMPLVSRLQMSPEKDRLWLAYNSFFSELEIEPPAGRRINFRFLVTRKSAAQAELTLQLCLRAGESLETAAGRRVTLGAEKIVLEDLGGWIRHRGWTLRVDGAARLEWPVYPFNPYADGPERELRWAVGALSAPLGLADAKSSRPALREFAFSLESVE